MIKFVIKFVVFLFDLLTPRFIVENCAFKRDENGDLYNFCREVDLMPGEAYEKILPIRSFNFFGFALFPELVEEERVK